MMIERLINNVLDVPKVEGICLFDPEGEPLINRLPQYSMPELLEAMLPRIVSLYETVDENFLPCDDYLLKYPGKWILVRRGNNFYTLTIMEQDTNLITLKMVTNLLLKNMHLEALKEFALESHELNHAISLPTRNATKPPFSSTTQSPFSATHSKPVSATAPRPTRKRSFRGNSY